MNASHSGWTPLAFEQVAGVPASPPKAAKIPDPIPCRETNLPTSAEPIPLAVSGVKQNSVPGESAAKAEVKVPTSTRQSWGNLSCLSPLSYADLQTADPNGKAWIWKGYLARGNVTLLTSQWKTGKSTLVSVLLARLRMGGELAGLPVTAGRAVVVSEEPASQWYERGQKLLFGEHLHWYCRPFKGKPHLETWLELLDGIGRRHRELPIDLLVIDSFANLAPVRSENEAGEVLKAVLPLQDLASRGMSVLLSHHPRKGVVREGQAARGSGALSGLADVIIEMFPVSWRNLKDRRRRLQGYSRHEETPAKWIIELSADGADYLSLGDSAEPSFERGWPVLKQILHEAEGPLTRRDILRRWPESALPPAKITLWKWLDRVVKEGDVFIEGTGTRKDPHRYRLPGMEGIWQERFLQSFMKKLDAMPEAKMK